MALRIEDYAIIGDCKTAALVGRDGSVDWLCWPRFDSAACFAALLGTPEHGRWLIAAADPNAKVTRRYRDDTLILETDFETPDGAVTLIDFMPVGARGIACGAHRHRTAWAACHAVRTRAPLRLRLNRALGHPPRRRHAGGDRRTRHGSVADAHRTARRTFEDGWRLHRFRRPDLAVRAHLWPIPIARRPSPSTPLQLSATQRCSGTTGQPAARGWASGRGLCAGHSSRLRR